MQKTAAKDKAYQAFRILQAAFVIVPLIAGLDKFMHLLTEWTKYLSPMMVQLVNHYNYEFMFVVGVVEVIAGLGVLFKPKIFAYVVAAWLLCIVINLLTHPNYFDIALRDFGLALGAIALGRLSQKYT